MVSLMRESYRRYSNFLVDQVIDRITEDYQELRHGPMNNDAVESRIVWDLLLNTWWADILHKYAEITDHHGIARVIRERLPMVIDRLKGTQQLLQDKVQWFAAFDNHPDDQTDLAIDSLLLATDLWAAMHKTEFIPIEHVRTQIWENPAWKLFENYTTALRAVGGSTELIDDLRYKLPDVIPVWLQ